MLPVHQAEQLILSLVHPFNPDHDVEVLDLLKACDRVLAAPIISQLDFPHWDNSAMDGYAVRFADVQTCRPDQPIELEIVEEIPAGYQPQHTIQPGQAARILTGSVMPSGADTVVMQEDTRRQDERVWILTTPKPQAFVRHQGEFYRAGAVLLPAGIMLGAPEIAVLAAAQCASVKVYRRPRVAILSTGSELVGVEQPLQAGQIVDSNQYALAALVAQAGAEPLCLGRVPDEPDQLRAAIVHAITTADIVLSSGGVSVGDYDYVDDILEELGADIAIRAVAMKPGKPLTVATLSDRQFASSEPNPSPVSPTLYFGLPGNPVSALVTFWRLVLPALRKLSGLAQAWQPAFVDARSRQVLRSDGKRETYLWGSVSLENGIYEFSPAGGNHSSGNLINLAQTNSLARLSVGQTQIAVGETVQVVLTQSLV
ncbi:MAG: molybdopterin molybdotransferase MoeA [Scytolyngbya sp. HA4215-MV1]|jgi:molybdopterin molybdotransferase|nr:molybdopterin molybdotransferase MoeA [Scytolyngbya sp. HA4215-MV1]